MNLELEKYKFNYDKGNIGKSIKDLDGVLDKYKETMSAQQHEMWLAERERLRDLEEITKRLGGK